MRDGRQHNRRLNCGALKERQDPDLGRNLRQNVCHQLAWLVPHRRFTVGSSERRQLKEEGEERVVRRVVPLCHGDHM